MDLSAFSEKSRIYLDGIDARTKALQPRQIAEHVESLVARQDDWRSRCLNLNPAESLMSRRARALLDSDMATRLTEGLPGDKLYPHGRLNENIDEIEAIIISLARAQFGAAYVDWRPVSTTMATAAVFHAVLKPGDVILAQDEDAGGNYVYQRVGPAGLIGVEVSPVPRLGEAFEIDLDALASEVARLKPRLIAIGGSNILFPYPLKEMREIADRVGALILYDASHVSLQVSAGLLQRPLEDGADILTFSTQKILGGPVGGMVMTHNKEIADRIARLVFPSLVQTRDLNKLSALAVAMAENREWGDVRAKRTVANAQALASALDSVGFELLARDRGYTQTQQLFLKVGEDARALETRCNDANIMLTDCALTGDMAERRRTGIRLGTHEVTRMGMSPGDMEAVARFIRRTADGEDTERLRRDVESCVGRFPNVEYSFDEV